jgi:hypothetical protein
MNKGFVSFVPVESFINKDYKLSRDERLDRMAGRYMDIGCLEEVSFGTWISATDALKRDGLFVVEAKSPTHKVRICFGEKQDGNYDLIGIMPKSIEHGITQAVTPIPRNEEDTRFQKIMACPERYVVITSSPPPIRRMAWIIGLNDVREVNAETTPAAASFREAREGVMS